MQWLRICIVWPWLAVDRTLRNTVTFQEPTFSKICPFTMKTTITEGVHSGIMKYRQVLSMLYLWCRD